MTEIDTIRVLYRTPAEELKPLFIDFLNELYERIGHGGFHEYREAEKLSFIKYHGWEPEEWYKVFG